MVASERLGSPAAFRATVRSVVQGELRPRLAGWAAAVEFPVGEVLRVLAQCECLGAGFSREQGGIGGDLWHSVVLHEELARLRMSALSTAVLSHLEVGTRLVADHATEATASAWVPPALTGRAVLGYAATEAEAGSDLAATTTAARWDGEAWVIDGGKKFISNARSADGLCVLVRTSDRTVTSHTLFLVPMAADGVSVTPLETLGNRGTLGEVRFQGVRVGKDAHLGLEGQGLMVQIRRLAHERAFVAVVLAALAARSLEVLVPRCRGEAARLRVAELRADVEEARCLAYHAVATVAAGQDARAVAAMAKLLAARANRRVTTEAVLVGGADADDRSTTEAEAYYDALGFAFAGGSDNMLLEAIAR